jgi:hypothetical protein
MAGRKLTDEEKAHYNERMAMTRASKEKEAAAKYKAEAIKRGVDPSPKGNTRSAEQIMADIEKVKQDPKFQKKMEAYKAAQTAKQGTQEGHAVTPRSNSTRTVRGGGLGGAMLGGGGGGLHEQMR